MPCALGRICLLWRPQFQSVVWKGPNSFPLPPRNKILNIPFKLLKYLCREVASHSTCLYSIHSLQEKKIERGRQHQLLSCGLTFLSEEGRFTREGAAVLSLCSSDFSWRILAFENGYNADYMAPKSKAAPSDGAQIENKLSQF